MWMDGGSNSRKALKNRLKADTPSGNWPTPTVNMVSGGANHNSPQVLAGNHGINLAGAVMKAYETPTARMWKDNGKSPSELSRNSETLAMQAGGALNPNWVEWLMNWPIHWTELKNENECDTQESTKSYFNEWLEVSSLQFNGKFAQASSRLQQAIGCGNNLREMPRKTTRFRTLEKSLKNENMSKLQQYFYLQTSKTANMQSILRSQIGMGKSWWQFEPEIERVASGVNYRMDRLKAIGNGQVPLCAATAFELLRERFNLTKGETK